MTDFLNNVKCFNHWKFLSLRTLCLAVVLNWVLMNGVQAGLIQPGDVDASGKVDLSDPIVLLGALFQGQPSSLCGFDFQSEENQVIVDFNGDEMVDLTDGIAMLSWMFLGTQHHAAGIDCINVPSCPAVCDDPLDILEATITEIDSHISNTDPKIKFSLTLAGLPKCNGNQSVKFGFLLDKDGLNTTGFNDALVTPLGVDAKIDVFCNPVTGELESQFGIVSTQRRSSDGAYIIEILGSVSNLPSVEFRWIAFMNRGAEFTRLPEKRSSYWGYRSISLRPSLPLLSKELELLKIINKDSGR